MDDGRFLTVERRIRLEFTAWPQLALTLRQASRLWDLPLDVCEAALTVLVASGFLEDNDGRFCQRGLRRYLYRNNRVVALTRKGRKDVRDAARPGIDS